MLLVDNILLAPASGFMFILKQILHAAEQDQANEADNLRAELSQLYMMLETRQITEDEFAAQEATLLDRLTRLEEKGTDVEEGTDAEEGSDADDDPQTDR